MKLLLTRTYQDTNTLGQIDVISDRGDVVETYYTLELPWKNNEKQVSCIPVGIYPVVKHVSPKFGKCFWLQDVPNRSEILIHPANYTSELKGCIAVGMDHDDINKDGELDVTKSLKAFGEILKYNITEIKIVEI